MKLVKSAMIENIYDMLNSNGDSRTVSYIKIPHYQRPYTWEEKEITKLFVDFQRNREKEEDEDYFVGALVTAKEQGRDYHEMVDGQQRVTTLYLIAIVNFLIQRAFVYDEIYCGRSNRYNEWISNIDLCYRKYLCFDDSKRFEKLKKDIIEELDKPANSDTVSDSDMILEWYSKAMNYPERNFSDVDNFIVQDANGIKDFFNEKKLILQYAREHYNVNLHEVISKISIIYENTREPELIVSDIENAADYEKTYLEAFKSIFDNVKKITVDKNNPDNRKHCIRMFEYLNYMLEHITFCVITTENKNDAYTLFEVLNDRAKAINDIDLIKNLFFRTYCENQSVDDDNAVDTKIGLLDTIWGDVFSPNMQKNKSKLVQYLSTIYLTKSSTINYKDDQKFRESMQEYLDAKTHYEYEDIRRDFNIYRMMKILVDKINFSYDKSTDKVLYAENSSNYSITYKAFHLLRRLELNGVLVALAFHIIYLYENQFMNGDLNVDDFKRYLDELINDANNDNAYYRDIHRTAFELRRAALLSKNEDKPRDIAIKFIKNLEIGTTSFVDLSSVELELKKQFINWTDSWKYNSGNQDLKLKVLFMELLRTRKEQDTLSFDATPRRLNDSKEIQLDHLEAQNIIEESVEKYFTPKSSTDLREQYVNCLGNMMILDSKNNNKKNNKPLWYALSFYDDFSDHWVVEEIKEMLNSEEYSNKQADIRVPNENFFNERRKKMQEYFVSLLVRKFDETSIAINHI